MCMFQPLFAFIHAAESPRPVKDGWKAYSAEKEYERLGIPQSRLWKLVDINADYKYSETYPRIVSEVVSVTSKCCLLFQFAIPTASFEKGKPFLKKLAEYRSKERIPVLSWINQTTLASITRSSQPLTGLSSRKSSEDEL